MEKGKNQNNPVSFFHEHMVPICCVFSIADKQKPYVVTAFILSAEDEWFLITAGHVAKDLLSYLENPDFHLKGATLFDYGGYRARYLQPVPFDLTAEKLVVLGDEQSYDYAFIYLGNYYRRLLEENGIRALNEEVWLRQPRNPTIHVLIGVPNQLVSEEYDNKTAITNLFITSSLFFVRHVQSRPSELKETQHPRWYGYINLNEQVDDIKGVSGAPILACEETGSGELRYFLVAVQSTWHPGTRAISACPVNLLVSFLANAVKEYRNNIGTD